MNHIVKNSLLVGLGSVGGFIIGAITVTKVVLGSEYIVNAVGSKLAKDIVNYLYGDQRNYNKKVHYGTYYQKDYKSSSRYSDVCKEKEFVWTEESRPRFIDKKDAVDTLRAFLELSAEYQRVSVGDLYELSGISNDFTDSKFGWSEDVLKSATNPIVRIQNAWVIDLPTPVKLE